MSGDVVHRLGVALAVIVGLWWLVRSCDTARRGRRLRARLTRVLALAAEPPRRRLLPQGAVRRWLPVAGAVCAGWVLVGGYAGLLVGPAAGVGAWLWLRRARRAGKDLGEAYDAAEAARQLPLAADLLAACITAGASPVVAAQAVGEALGGPVGERLARGAAEARLGGEPAEAWRSLAELPGARALARLLERADESGVPAAAPVARLAAEARAEWGRSATERARRAAVMVTAPVGLCFLPAFIAVGVLPVVIGLADGLLGGGAR
ncbi:type II secretion system F family protein [Streptomyces caniscabiei]|uniref:type II secretion system F family protein n=1 Tax=Streptomyces caniscabiei TaxID=2746961 RepID=UPI000A3A0B30|nr:type II secretion system F family protein [Streptomyces caniscabiei]MBD9703457.1 type II secretion system F family protein [Streptomyces caniscabiei]MDX3726951.1 type II secretion system F family protein [Streptomyces caniscabiei]